MANADMNRLMNNARIRLPGALDATIQLELFTVLDEFFQTSNIWTEDLTFNAVPTEATYLEDPDALTYEIVPTNGVINRLVGVVDSKGFGQNATMAIPGYVVLTYSPNTADTYTARVALTVTDPTTRDGYPEFPDWILNKYSTGILDGVVGRMMSQLAKPYSSPSVALYHLKKFKQTMSQAKVETQHKNVYGGQSWRFPQTFATNRYSKF